MTRHLTDRQKAEWLNILIERDGGFKCWYCNKEFLSQSTNSQHLYDHLNNNLLDNRIDNVVLCCYSCNNSKPYNFDMAILATEKLHENEKRNYMREKFEKKSTNRHDSEVRISKTNYQICSQYIIKNVDAFGEIDYKETILSIVYLCRQNDNTGSPQSVNNYLAIMCCKITPFEIVKKDGKKIIRRKAK